MPSYDWANSMVLFADVFWCGEFGFSTVGVGVILQKGCGIQGQNLLQLFQENEMAAD